MFVPQFIEFDGAFEDEEKIMASAQKMIRDHSADDAQASDMVGRRPEGRIRKTTEGMTLVEVARSAKKTFFDLEAAGPSAKYWYTCMVYNLGRCHAILAEKNGLRGSYESLAEGKDIVLCNLGFKVRLFLGA